MGLDAQLCFRLATAARAISACYRPLLGPLGLTHPQYLVMLVMWERRSIRMGELGDRLQLGSSTLSPLLARLEQAGLITRRRHTGDGRSVEVHLTSAGARVQQRAAAVPTVVARATGLTPAEMSNLHETLQVLTMRLQAAELGDGGDRLPGARGG